MKRSSERILVTHAGSLARPDDLMKMLIAKNEGQPYGDTRPGYDAYPSSSG